MTHSWMNARRPYLFPTKLWHSLLPCRSIAMAGILFVCFLEGRFGEPARSTCRYQMATREIEREVI